MSTTLDLGLVMAGAVSAGAYTGGVMDFLLQALDAWYAEKDRPGSDAPPHDVRLRVATGASAGGMTAAMMAITTREAVPPVTPDAGDDVKARNKFYDAWVRQVAIEKLLEDNDLRGNTGPVRSVLDSTVLDRIADRMFAPSPAGVAPPRPYVANPFVVALTLTNLRGVPYQLKFLGAEDAPVPYTMRLHADQLTFAVGAPSPLEAITPPDKAIPLDPTRVGQGEWPTLVTAALATGAFPFGLAPRTLRQAAGTYDDRVWYHPYPRTVDGRHECGFFAPLKAAMGVRPDFDYVFTCVDGGTIDNEPVGMAREHLGWAGRAGSPQPSAILLIDPFPNQEAFQPEYDFPQAFSLFRLAPALLGALMGQARFKPEELTRAMDPAVFNQFMLAPVRRRPGSRVPERYPIACGGLGGFGGFLSEEFRAHDFRLGRLNAQAFLRRHFVLPESDPLFAGWSATAKDRYRVRRDARNRVVEHEAGRDMVYDAAGQPAEPVPPLSNFLPVIPLTGPVTRPEPVPEWPEYTREELSALRYLAGRRANRVVDRLIRHLDGWIPRLLLRGAWALKRRGWLHRVFAGTVEPDLVARGLMK
jgi:hypothetical protein